MLSKWVLILFLLVLIGAQNRASANTSMINSEHEKWLLERNKEARSIKPGMSRTDLLKVFAPAPSGSDSKQPARFVLKSCPEIYIEVLFDQAGGIRPAEQKITEQATGFESNFPLMLAAPDMEYTGSTGTKSKHEQWLLERIKEARSIKPGMSRGALLKVFKADVGGLQSVPTTSYDLKSCGDVRLHVIVSFDKRKYSLLQVRPIRDEKEFSRVLDVLNSDMTLPISTISPLYLYDIPFAMD